jgi:5'(3')-deoxyribonucleotidase
VLRVAVDVDGVLADQVSVILSRLNEKYGSSYSKADIVEWDQKLEATNIKVEIENALLDEDYVLSLPIIEGAKQGMDYLFKNHFVIIATARPKETEEATKKWVSRNFSFHAFFNTKGKCKSTVNSDVLVDDYIPNIQKFVEKAGYGILFSQPWNEDRSKIQNLLLEGKVTCCDSWRDVTETIEKIARNK